jgi:glycosyltransferase involved in cell wall biosynthesis
VTAALRSASALVLGSRWPENCPMVVIEARAAGCPVVAPRIGGLPELIQEGRDGFLYRPGDGNALAAALRAVVERPPSNVRLPLSHREQVDRTIAVYRRVLTPAKPCE